MQGTLIGLRLDLGMFMKSGSPEPSPISSRMLLQPNSTRLQWFMDSNVSPLPPPQPRGAWLREVQRGPLMMVPYLAYVFGQVMFAGRGAIGYEFNGEHDEGFVLYLLVEDTDRQACESLADAEEVWVRCRPGKWA